MPGVGVAVSPCFGRPAAAAWSPLDLGAKLDFWLVATDGSVARSGSDVTTWTSLGGGGGNATAVATKAPTYNATGWSDGGPTVDFSNAGTAMELASLSPTGDDHWAASVLNVQTGDSAGETFYSPVGAIIFGCNRLGSPAILDGAWKTAAEATTTGEQSALWLVDSAGPTATIYRDGSALTGLTYDGSGGGSAVNPTIGARSTDQSGTYLQARVKVAMGGQGVLTASEIASLNTYLGSFL